jgi:hypothetical protein
VELDHGLVFFNLGAVSTNARQMTKNRVSLRENRPGSPDSSDEDSSDMKSPEAKSPELKSPVDEKIPSRGRKDARSTDTMDMV